MLQQIIDNTGIENRTRLKMVKMFGKHFLKPIPKDSPDYQRWKKESTAILWDTKTDKDLLEFLCKLKKTDSKNAEFGACQYYYVPELNGTEAAVIANGHHSLHDGISEF